MDAPLRDGARHTILDRDIAGRIDDLLAQAAPTRIGITAALATQSAALLSRADLFQPHADRVAAMLEDAILKAGDLADATGREILLDRGALSATQCEAARLLLSEIAQTALPDATDAARQAASFTALTDTQTIPLASSA
jgi:predicted phage gp36 major capsid-like protein